LSCKATYLLREAKIKKIRVGACIDVDGVCGDIGWWKRIVKHRSFRAENIPISLTNAIAAFPAVECAKVKGTVVYVSV
jgi:hypothetical protein